MANKKWGNVLQLTAHCGAYSVFVALLILLIALSIPVSVDLSNYFNQVQWEVKYALIRLFLALLFVIAPVLQITGAIPFWKRQLPAQWSKQKYLLLLQRTYICIGYIITVIAIVWAYLLSNAS